MASASRAAAGDVRLRPPVYGHRGVPGRCPENTLASFLQARMEGAAGIEFDVRLTADGTAVVLHDARLDRTTTGTGAVAQASLEYVRSLSAGAAMGAAFAGERVPTLREVCELAVSERLLLDIELKGAEAPARVVDAVVRDLEATGWLANDARASTVLVTSFDARLLEAAAQALPRVAIGFLLDVPAGPARSHAVIDAAVERGARAGARLFLPPLEALIADPGDWNWRLPTMAWCGPLPGDAAAILPDLPLAGLITDEPARAALLLTRSDSANAAGT
jgi:glycerophosphoryl diester phosphodiesterase